MPIQNKKKTIEERYKKLDEIDHILLRSGMYVGSVKNETRQFFLWDAEEESLVSREVEYCPALLKLIDEVISNSCDEFQRKDNLGLNEVTVTMESWVTDDGESCARFICYDNGGIPVVMHKDAQMYVPEMIFSQLRTSSNYDDDESKTWVGTNGVGAKLTGVFSKKFKIETSDGKNSFSKSWQNNMRTPDDNAVIKRSKDHYTRLTYDFDLEKFDDIDGFSDDFCDVIEKRCIDAAAANIGLKVKFISRVFISGEADEYTSEWKFDSFQDYLKLFSSYIDIDEVISNETPQYNVYAFPNSSISLGFVNGASCDNGTHMKLVQNTINDFVADFIKTKKKLEVTPKEITGKYGFFCTFRVNAVEYDSQSKTTLTTPVNKFFDEGITFNLPKKFFDAVSKSEIIDSVVDWISQRDQANNQKALRELNKEAKKKVVASEKYIPAHGAGNNKILSIYEGNSAGAGFRTCRPNAQQYGAYLLRGVTLQTWGMTAQQFMKNKEINDLVSILGLTFDKMHDTTDQNVIKNYVSTLNYNKIYICTDADPDGDHINGILLCFFAKFPWMIRAGIVCRNLTPLMICTKKSDIIKIYNFDEYEDLKKTGKLNGYDIRYVKGIGGLSDNLMRESLENPKLKIYTYDDMTNATLNRWFSKKSVKDRRSEIEKQD